MDVFAVKNPKEFDVGQTTGNGNGGKNPSIAGLANSFRDLVGRVGSHLGADIRINTDGTDLNATIDRGLATATTDDRGDVRQDDFTSERDDGRNRPTTDGDRPAGEQRTESADRSNDRVGDTSSDRNSQSDDHGESQARSDNGDDSGDRGRSSDAPAERSQDNAADKPAEQQNQASNDGQAQSGEAGEGAGKNLDAVAQAGNAAALGAQQNASGVLAGLLAQTQSASETGAKGPNQNAVSGLNTALAAVDKPTAVDGAGQGQANANGPAQQSQAGVHAAQAAKANANANAALNANGADEANLQGASNADRQAADLSQKIGPGKGIAVQVAVTDEADTLISKPTSTLAPTTVLAGEAGGRQQQAQANGHGAQNAQGQAAAQAGQQQAAAQAASGQQTAAQAAQNQAAAGGGTEAKGPSVTAVHGTGAAQAAGSAGSEATAAPATNAANQAAEAQKSAAAKLANPQHTNTTRQAVLDQVSVQITKALKAGVDRINIQLKPANLGRIEVNLELTQDGRVAAVVTADNKDTLDLLQRDAKSLEEALIGAGLDTDLSSMNFGLRGEQGEGSGNGGPAGDDDVADDDGLAEQLATPAHQDGIQADGRLDIRA